MATETASAEPRPIFILREKRKFNWLVLAMLAIVAVGLAWQFL